jgi:type IV secretory pathway VirB2 component (pilin)
MNTASTQFSPPTQSVFEAINAWVMALLSGQATTVLCTIAIAVLGYSLMAGRIPIRKAILAVLGCFLLFGATHLANDLQKLARSNIPVEPDIITVSPPPEIEPEAPLPPANYDPYAGAAIRTDR